MWSKPLHGDLLDFIREVSGKDLRPKDQNFSQIGIFLLVSGIECKKNPTRL